MYRVDTIAGNYCIFNNDKLVIGLSKEHNAKLVADILNRDNKEKVFYGKTEFNQFMKKH